MLVEESMHISFDETNPNMQEITKTGADHEFLLDNKLILDCRINQRKLINYQKINQLN